MRPEIQWSEGASNVCKKRSAEIANKMQTCNRIYYSKFY